MISRGARKLTQTPIITKKKKKARFHVIPLIAADHLAALSVGNRETEKEKLLVNKKLL
jgi:hypothetical protein